MKSTDSTVAIEINNRINEIKEKYKKKRAELKRKEEEEINEFYSNLSKQILLMSCGKSEYCAIS